MVVHNETSTGVTSRIRQIREALDRANHPALLLVDTISSLGSIDYQHDAWGVDVTVSCSQKGLMLPPGLGFNAVSDKALAAAKANATSRAYWDWHDIIRQNESGGWPYTPATNLLYGLKEAIAMLMEEGLENVFARHLRLAAATRAAVRGWGLEILCQNPEEFSPVADGGAHAGGPRRRPVSRGGPPAISTCRSAPDCRRSRGKSSASATSATSTN